MALLVPSVGEAQMLTLILAGNTSLRLFQNNHTPAEADGDTDYTVATFTGYANVTLTGGSWSITTGDPSFATYAQQTFSSSANQSAQTIYGYYVVHVASGVLLWAELFSSPVVIANNGDQIKITPRFELA